MIDNREFIMISHGEDDLRQALNMALAVQGIGLVEQAMVLGRDFVLFGHRRPVGVQLNPTETWNFRGGVSARVAVALVQDWLAKAEPTDQHPGPDRGACRAWMVSISGSSGCGPWTLRSWDHAVLVTPVWGTVGK